MAKKKVTKRGTVEKAAPKSGVNKTQEIKKALAATPGKSPKEISEALTAKGIEISPAYVSTIKTLPSGGVTQLTQHVNGGASILHAADIFDEFL